jgi:hypothetical protein
MSIALKFVYQLIGPMLPMTNGPKVKKYMTDSGINIEKWNFIGFHVLCFRTLTNERKKQDFFLNHQVLKIVCSQSHSVSLFSPELLFVTVKISTKN